MVRAAVVAAGALAVVGLAGCSGAAETGQGERVGAAATGLAPSASPSPADRSDQPVPVETAGRLPRAAYELIARTKLRVDGHIVGINTVDARGAALMIDVESSGELRHDPTDLFIRNADGSREEVPRLPGEPRQIAVADLNRRWAVWQETPSLTLGPDPWVQFAYNRRTGETVELTRAPSIDGGPPPFVPGYTGPVLAGNWVYWVQVSGTFGAERADVYGCLVEECEPRPVMKGAAHPSSDGKYLYAVANQWFEGKHQRGGTTRIQKIPVGSDEVTTVVTVELAKREAVDGLAASADRLVWTVTGRPYRAVVYDLATGESEEFLAERNGGFGYPVAGRTFVAWAESSGSARAQVGGYVWTEDGGLHSIGNNSGLYGIEAAGDYLYWQDSVGPRNVPRPDIREVEVRIK